ncbi:hypothetical protein BD769DRAFT_1465743 [Suillus cothurnatus]|nr:hypothetical protein BD769DRAFT_1465743 [Suillus cothurnatus]
MYSSQSDLLGFIVSSGAVFFIKSFNVLAGEILTRNVLLCLGLVYILVLQAIWGIHR